MRQINRTARGDSFFRREFHLWGRAQVPAEGMGRQPNVGGWGFARWPASPGSWRDLQLAPAARAVFQVELGQAIERTVAQFIDW